MYIQNDIARYHHVRLNPSLPLIAFVVMLSIALLSFMCVNPCIAQAKGSYKIVYKLNGGKQAKGQVEKVKKGATLKVSKLKSPKKTGYKFKGWYKNKSLTKKAQYVKGKKKKSTRTLYAKWSPKSYKITYKLSGGKLSGKYAKTYRYTKGAKLPTPKLKGYEFVGWYSNKAKTKKVSKISTKARGDKTLYAKWKRVKYSITYVPNGGSLSGTYAKTYDVKSKLKLPVPKRTGYVFLGWYTNKSLTKPINSIAPGMTGNKKLYAKWVKRTVTAHRGYHVGHAQNSIDAYVAAAEKGFTYVETDVRFTKDGVPILAHDATIPVYKYSPVVEEPENPEEPEPGENGGEGSEPGSNVNALSEEGGGSEDVDTIEEEAEDDGDPEYMPSEVRAFSTSEPIIMWDVSEHTYNEIQEASLARTPSGPNSTNISTYKEFLQVCAEYDLVPVIDLKAGSKSQIRKLMQWAESYGVYDRAIWGSSSFTRIGYVTSYDSDVSIGYYSNSITATKVNRVQKLQDAGADVRISTHATKITSTTVKLCKNARIPLGVYGIKNESYAGTVNAYVSSFSIDSLESDRVPETL